MWSKRGSRPRRECPEARWRGQHRAGGQAVGIADEGVGRVGAQAKGVGVAGAGEEGGGLGGAVVVQGQAGGAEQGLGVGGVPFDGPGVEAGGLETVGGGFGFDGGAQGLAHLLGGGLVVQERGGERGAVAEIDRDGADDDGGRGFLRGGENGGEVLAERAFDGFEMGIAGGQASAQGNGFLAAPGLQVHAGGKEAVEGVGDELGEAGAGEQDHPARDAGTGVEASQAGGGAVGAGDFVVAGQHDDGIGPEARQVAGDFAQHVGVGAVEAQGEDFDGMAGIAVLEHEFELPGQAEGGFGHAHGGGTAQQADPDGAFGRGLEGDDGQGGGGEAAGIKPVGEKGDFGPGGLAVRFAGDEKPRGASGEKQGGQQFEQEGGGGEEQQRETQPLELAKQKSRPGRQLDRVGGTAHAMGKTMAGGKRPVKNGHRRRRTAKRWSQRSDSNR